MSNYARYLNFNLLLIFVPIAIVGEFLHWPPLLVFALSALAVMPLASLIGQATEELAAHTGPRLGGFLNATLGNVAELIITIFAIRAGLLELVKASITGSILGNVLLVLGLSILLGGLKNGIQRFDRSHAGLNSTMLILAVVGLGIPSLFSHAIEVKNHEAVEYLSLGVALVLIVIYGLSLIYAFFAVPAGKEAEEAHIHRGWNTSKASGVLIAATLLIAWLSEILVGAVEPVVEAVGVTEFFLGIIIIPLVGNVAEHLVGVQMAIRNRMELSLAISVGSSLQIALFVAPALVFISLLMGNPLTLVFNQFELISLVAAVLIAALVSLDGESNWLEGAQLLVVYIIIGLAFFYLPT
ncbi:MAG: calcium/proton exchanger [Anaerolineae bacterium]|nr:calcium/proton exchanger [Anaerolineae bacterium]